MYMHAKHEVHFKFISAKNTPTAYCTSFFFQQESLENLLVFSTPSLAFAFVLFCWLLSLWWSSLLSGGESYPWIIQYKQHTMRFIAYPFQLPEGTVIIRLWRKKSKLSSKVHQTVSILNVLLELMAPLLCSLLMSSVWQGNLVKTRGERLLSETVKCDPLCFLRLIVEFYLKFKRV